MKLTISETKECNEFGTGDEDNWVFWLVGLVIVDDEPDILGYEVLVDRNGVAELVAYKTKPSQTFSIAWRSLGRAKSKRRTNTRGTRRGRAGAKDLPSRRTRLE